MKADVYKTITDKIVAAIEAGGTPPWKRPWKLSGGYPISIRSGKSYRGINVLLLGLASYDDPRWGTFKAMREAAITEAKAQGREIVTVQEKRGEQTWEIVNGERVWFRGGVRKGEKSTQIVLWKPVPKKDAGEGEPGSYWLLRFYAVFNAKQADGLPELPVEEEREFTPIELAEKIVDGYVWERASGNTGPAVMYGYDRAAYSPSEDRVIMPEPEQFDDDEAYYTTLFHELVHSTGHEKRLKRIETTLFGSDPYAKEELVAEIGASFLAGAAEFEDAGGDQSAAYLSGWMKRIKEQPKLIVQAAAQAQKAADLILKTKFEEDSLQAGDREPEAVAA